MAEDRLRSLLVSPDPVVLRQRAAIPLRRQLVPADLPLPDKHRRFVFVTIIERDQRQQRAWQKPIDQLGDANSTAREHATAAASLHGAETLPASALPKRPRSWPLTAPPSAPRAAAWEAASAGGRLSLREG